MLANSQLLAANCALHPIPQRHWRGAVKIVNRFLLALLANLGLDQQGEQLQRLLLAQVAGICRYRVWYALLHGNQLYTAHHRAQRYRGVHRTQKVRGIKRAV